MRILFLWENGKMLRDGKNGKRDEMEEGGRKKNPFFFFSMVRFVLVEKKKEDIISTIPTFVFLLVFRPWKQTEAKLSQQRLRVQIGEQQNLLFLASPSPSLSSSFSLHLLSHYLRP